MKISKFYLSAVFITLLLIPLQNDAAVAQTTDGETPAVEQICDELKGATPGLYGLCIACCEAHDGEFLENMTIAEAEESLKLNERILINYNKKRTETDPVMPCTALPEASSCTPLLSDIEWTKIMEFGNAPDSSGWHKILLDPDGRPHGLRIYRVNNTTGEKLKVVILTYPEMEGVWQGVWQSSLSMSLDGINYIRYQEFPKYRDIDHEATQACFEDVIIPWLESIELDGDK